MTFILNIKVDENYKETYLKTLGKALITASLTSKTE
jgi:hypothetical protein